MQIISLRFRGIGPFRDEQFIDFTQMGSSGLYLINGHTGAGKTTIIDAVCFALYNSPSGMTGGGKRLRSQFSGSGDHSEVDLVFETAEGRFRVIRTPAYSRPVKRGSGETTETAKCKVFRVEPDGREVDLYTKIEAANDGLRAIIGLTSEQFIQTIVLPQGKFETFLRSDTKARTDVLRNVFKTELYNTVADVLGDQASEAQKKIEALTSDIRATLQSAGWVSDPEQRDQLFHLVDKSLDNDLLEELTKPRPGLADTVGQAEAAATSAHEAFKAADSLRDKAKDEAAALEALTTAKDSLAVAHSSHDKAMTSLEEHTSLVLELDLAIQAGSTEEALRAAAAAIHEVQLDIARNLDAEKDVLEWPQTQLGLNQELRDGVELRERLEKELSTLPERQSELQRLIDARPSPEDWEALSLKEQDLQAQQKTLSELSDLEGALKELTSELEAAEAQSLAAQHAVEAARERWTYGIVGSLAQDLRPEQPCLVCGCTQHPRPAASADDLVTEADVAQRDKAAQQATQRVEELRAKQRITTERQEQLKNQLTLDHSAITATLESLTKEREALTQRGDKADGAQKERDKLALRHSELSSDISSQKTAEEKLMERIQLTQESVEHKRANVEQVRGSAASLSERKDLVGALAEVVAAAIASSGDLGRAKADEERARTVLAGLGQREGFGDVNAAEETWRAADSRRQDAEKALGERRNELKAFDQALGTVQRLCEERRRLQAGNADLSEVASLFQRGKGLDFGLEVFVLRKLFESVVEAANLRLGALLSGRFTLELPEVDQGDRRRTLGLGLFARDAFTGQTRPADTLSGGETFCASLALALGLADVVRMNAGGVTIGSLFIDEGFGSLDSEALEEVMAMLNGLSREGRQVGLISHVSEMKTAIAERIEVFRASESQPSHLEVNWMA